MLPARKKMEAEIERFMYLTPDFDELTEVFGAIGCATDFACVIIPIFIFHKLQINQRTKMAISAVIGLGLITATCAVGKSVTSTFQSEDPTYDFVPVEIWAGVEGNFGLTVACLPPLRSLFVNILNGSWSGLKPARKKGFKVGKAMKPFSELHNKALGRRHSHSDGDEYNLIPLGSIAVSKATEVESEHRQSSDMESPRDKG